MRYSSMFTGNQAQAVTENTAAPRTKQPAIVTTQGAQHSACQLLKQTQHIVLSCDVIDILPRALKKTRNRDRWLHKRNLKAHAG